MGAPGYYLITLDAEGEPDYDDDGLPVIDGDLVTLPIQARIGVKYGNRTFKHREKTGRGRNWNYPQWDAEFAELSFRLNRDTELPAFRTLHDAVSGDGDPFVFVFDTEESPPRTMFCRKEPHFEVVQVAGVAHGEEVDYTMTIEEEPTGPEITD